MGAPPLTAVSPFASLPLTETSPSQASHTPTILTPGSKFSLLLALADDNLAESAVRIASILSYERGAVPAVVQVFDPSPYAAPAPIPTLMVFAESLLGPDIAEERRQALRDKLANMCGHQVSWPVKVLFGTPSTCIIGEAQRRSSQLIVLGLHTYGRASRLLRSETALRVVENVESAVLAVTESLQDVPRKVLVAMDFSRASIRAAYLAARLVSPQGSLTLAYVQPHRSQLSSHDEGGALFGHRDGLTPAFTELAQEISTFSNVSVTTRRLEGDPSAALLQYADRSKSDLIAIGSQRHSSLQKFFAGTVTRRVVRDGRCSVLVVPPRPALVPDPPAGRLDVRHLLKDE